MERAGGGWVGRMAVGVAALALAVVVSAVLSGFGTRWGWWHFRTGFRMLGWSAMAGLGVAVLALIVLGFALARRGPPRAWLAAGFAVVAGVALFAVPWQWQLRARSVPPIHDISTDLADPPPFVAIAPLRADAPNPLEHPGDSTAMLQRDAYPDVLPLVLAESPPAAFDRALAATRSMGWDVVAADRADGRIEATDRTFWFGFRDDVVIRITAADAGTRVDVRSKSRVGRGDAGTNARRVLAYLDRLR